MRDLPSEDESFTGELRDPEFRAGCHRTHGAREVRGSASSSTFAITPTAITPTALALSA